MSPAPRFTPEEQLQLILDAAANCIERSSLLDFTMSAISKEAGLSIGSIYKHVQSKEDVLVALATGMYRHLYKIFSQILAFDLTIAEHLIALQLFCPYKSSLYSFAGNLDMLVSNEAVVQRASKPWLDDMYRIEVSIENMIMDKLLQGLSEGSMNIDEDEYAAMTEEVHIGVWSLGVGFVQVAQQRHARQGSFNEYELPFPLDMHHCIVRSSKRLINSYPWKSPLTDSGIEKVCILLEVNNLR